MNVHNFTALLDSIKMEPDAFHTSLSSGEMYGYDVKAEERTYMTDSILDKDKGLVVSNPLSKELHHVCVDGGLVKYGLYDYVGDGEPHGRFDSILYTEEKVLFVEYKMESTSDKDKTKWARFSDGMNQIADYFVHMLLLIQLKSDDFWNYYSKENVIPFICMSNIPNMNPRVNAQRFAEMEKFRLRTGLKIKYGTSIEL